MEVRRPIALIKDRCPCLCLMLGLIIIDGWKTLQFFTHLALSLQYDYIGNLQLL